MVFKNMLLDGVRIYSGERSFISSVRQGCSLTPTHTTPAGGKKLFKKLKPQLLKGKNPSAFQFSEIRPPPQFPVF